MSLQKLFKPRSVAVVGASESDGLGGKTARRFAEEWGDRADCVYYVNPNRETTFGLPSYPSLAEVPGPIDLVVIATAKSTVEDNLRAAIAKGAGGAIIYASGYSETGDPRDIGDEARLRALCRENGVSVLGPNCAGYINFVDRVFPFGFHFTMRERPGRVGVVSQSGQVCTSLLISPKADFSYLISSGNSKITPIEEYLDFLVEDEDTYVIAAYLEGVSDPRKFIGILEKAARKQKPVVLLKTGRSDMAAKVAASHTGSLTGSDVSFEAVFRKFGVIRADDIEELLSICSALALMPSLPTKNSVGLVCGSGGESAMSADLCELAGLGCPDFTARTKEALGALLPDFASANNPLDTTAQVIESVESYERAVAAVAEDANVELVIAGLPIYKQMRIDTGVMVEALERYMTYGKAPVVAVPTIETDRVPEMADRLKEAGIPLLPSSKTAFQIVRKIMDYAQWRQSLSVRSLTAVFPRGLAGVDTKPLSEQKSKALLAEYGVPVPSSRIATSAEEAGRFAEEVGFPVVMKIESDEILHKSDVGGVLLPVNSAEEARAGYETILANVRSHLPGASVNGVLVQHMLPKGMEVIVGVNNDPQFGPMLLLGLGGVFVEVFQDLAVYPCPLNRDEALLMIGSLRSSVLFHGYRGEKALDVGALADAMVAVSDMAVARKDDLLELDINPIFVYEQGQGVAPADALVILRQTPEEG